MATRTWTAGDSSGVFSNPLNWLEGVAPANGDDIVIEATAFSLVIPDTGATYGSLNTNGNPVIVEGNTWNGPCVIEDEADMNLCQLSGGVFNNTVAFGNVIVGGATFNGLITLYGSSMLGSGTYNGGVTGNLIVPEIPNYKAPINLVIAEEPLDPSDPGIFLLTWEMPVDAPASAFLIFRNNIAAGNVSVGDAFEAIVEKYAGDVYAIVQSSSSNVYEPVLVLGPPATLAVPLESVAAEDLGSTPPRNSFIFFGGAFFGG